jgi:hypothetical protein
VFSYSFPKLASPLFKKVFLMRHLLACSVLALASISSPIFTNSTFAQAKSIEPAKIDSVAAMISPAMVNIKFVMSLDFGGQSQDIEREISALAINDKGLFLVVNGNLGAGMGGRMRGMGNIQPKEIKVSLTEDSESLPAKLIGRDSELDLAWIQLDKPADKPLVFLDLTKGATAAAGQTVFAFELLGKFYDKAPMIVPTSVGAVVSKPRKMYVPTDTRAYGMPFFTTDGQFLGLSVLQTPISEDEAESAMQDMMKTRMSMYDFGVKILPASEINDATKRALEAHASGKDQSTDKGAEKPADSAPATPATPETKP